MRWDVQGEARALRRIVALLLALAQLAERAGSMAVPVRVIVLAVLRHAETVAFAFACGIPLAAAGRPPLQPIPPRLPLAAQSGPAEAARLAFSLRVLALILAHWTTEILSPPPAPPSIDRVQPSCRACGGSSWFGPAALPAPDTS
ncbi:MAG: hypothetical protein ACK4F5_08410 [Aliihoeflea sp.]